MSMFVEVESVEKGCKVIINMDMVLEIAPLTEGGCALFFSDSAAVGGKTAMKVSDSYDQFKQFVVTPVSADDIARRFPKATVPAEAPAKGKDKKNAMPEYDIPKL